MTAPYFPKILDGPIFWLITVSTKRKNVAQIYTSMYSLTSSRYPFTSLGNIRILFVFVTTHFIHVDNISTHVCKPISHPEQPCVDTGVCCHPHVTRMKLQSMTGSTWLWLPVTGCDRLWQLSGMSEARPQQRCAGTVRLKGVMVRGVCFPWQPDEG